VQPPFVLWCDDVTSLLGTFNDRLEQALGIPRSFPSNFGGIFQLHRYL
jgi:hypothetical protein